jgi:hypothetical protein
VSSVLKVGGIAAYLNAAVASATLTVALGLVGPSALADRQKLVELAITRPAPLIIQDILKFMAAVIAVAMIAGLFRRLRGGAPTQMRVAAMFGLLAALCLVLNATLSLFAIWQAGNAALMSSPVGARLPGIIGVSGLAVILLGGVWYLLVNWAALKQKQFPRRLSYLGLSMGALSLIPVLGIMVLLCSIPWSVGVGRVLLRGARAG